MYKECEGCKSANICSTAVQPGSVMCQVNRMKSGQTKAEYRQANQIDGKRCCPYCGRPIN